MQAAQHLDISDLLTTAPAARLGGVASETIRMWARTGRLPVACQTASGVRLFRREDVERVATAGANARKAATEAAAIAEPEAVQA